MEFLLLNMSTRPAKLRKRDAVGNLRDVAEVLGVRQLSSRNKPDSTEPEFVDLHDKVAAKAASLEHRPQVAPRRLHCTGAPTSRCCQMCQNYSRRLQRPLRRRLAPSEAQNATSEGFRLRSSSCLFTWNNTICARTDLEVLWVKFVAW